MEKIAKNYRILKVKGLYRIQKRILFFFWEEIWVQVALMDTIQMTTRISTITLDDRKVRFETYGEAYKFFKTYIQNVYKEDYKGHIIKAMFEIQSKKPIFVNMTTFITDKVGFDYVIKANASTSKKKLKAFIDNSINNEIIVL